MSSNAPGQLLGYTIQYPRALYHLLNLPSNGYVCIEVLGDVASVLENGEIINEEDKSSINSNPLTNKSKDLWKTFYNWINAINNGSLEINKTKFVLYCNQKGKKALVDDFNAYSLSSSKDTLKSNINKVLSSLDTEHEIYKYYDFVINKNFDVFTDVLLNFELQRSNETCYKEIWDSLDLKIVPDNMKDYLIKSLSGWLQFYVMEKIKEKENAIISFNIFQKEFLALFSKVRTESLIDWAIEPVSDDTINKHIEEKPNFIKHLNFISTSDDKIIEAISDYIKADINRSQWIENGVLDVDSALDFESKLKTYHQSQDEEIQIVHNNLDDEKKGKLLYSRCKSRRERINNVDPPDRTIPGTYHALSDRNELGWHPKWNNLINTEEEG